jgi:hypothetical protein
MPILNEGNQMSDPTVTGQETPAVDSEAQTPAATTEQVATPEAGTDPAKEEEGSQAEAKTFTQDELNEIIQKEKAKAEAKAERRALKAYRETLERFAPAQQPVQQQDDGKPSRAQYADDEAYVDALTDWKLDQRDRSLRQQTAVYQQQNIAKKTESLYAQAEKIEGFDREEFDSLPLTPAMANVLLDAEAPAKLMAFMAANPDEVARIAAFSPARQAAEIGKLEAKLSVAKASNAPAPIKPIGSRGTTSPNLEKASMDEYMAMRLKQKPAWAR